MKKLKSILYIEDEPSVQEQVANFLRRFCDELHLANNGLVGLKEFKKHKPQLTISDIRMPKMNGLELCQEIRKIDEDAHIILLTAFSDTEYFQSAIEAQVDGYLIKPIDFELLRKKIENIKKSIDLQLELAVKKEMLLQQSKMASIGQMISNISHQWKQPLAVIRTCSSGIELDCDYDDIQKDKLLNYAKNIDDQIDYLDKTISDFKDFFKPVHGDTKYKVKTYLEKCIQLLGASLKETYVDVYTEIDEDINSFGNPNFLIQAAINILNNAKDALKKVEESNRRLIFIMSIRHDDKSIFINIKDNAGGIPQDTIDRVFDPYFTTKGEEGTGLGLYITKIVVEEKLKGKISVTNEEFEFENRPYKGANFTIELPYKES